MSADSSWETDKDDIFDVISDIDDREARIQYVYLTGYIAGDATEAEVKRLRWALARTGGLERLAQCPSCLAERTNGEHHADDCPLVAQIEALKTEGSR